MPYIKKMLYGKWTGSYIFSLSLLGKRFRKVVRIKASAVSAICKKWEKDIIESFCNPEKKFKLFEILKEYLIYTQKTKTNSIYKQYDLTLGLFKQYIEKELKINNPFLDEIKRNHILDFLTWRKFLKLSNQVKNECTPSTLNHDVKKITAFFNWCIDREYYNKSILPTRKIKFQEVKRTIMLTTDQIQEIFDKADDSIYPFIALAFFSGLRRNEIITLQWANIDFEKNLIFLLPEFTKSKKSRSIYMPETLSTYLIELKKKYQQSKFIVNKTNFRKNWLKLRNQLSFNPLSNGLLFHFHDIRHLYAQSLKDNGAPMHEIQSLLGHASVSTTEIYAGLDSRNLADTVKRLDGMIILRHSENQKIENISGKMIN